jgi:hypothetical protein
MRSPRARASLMALMFLVGLGPIACDKGPAQKAGEKVDKTIDTDKAIGKGPVEKAGKEIDKAAEGVKDAVKK